MSKVALVAPPDVTNHNDPIPVFTPGCIVEDDEGKRYKYVRFLSSGTSAYVGHLAYYVASDTTCKSVTRQFTVCAGQNAVAGVFLLSEITNGYYTFILIEGVRVVSTDGGDNIVAGDLLVASTTNGVVTRSAAGTAPPYRVVGWAVTDDNDTYDYVTAYLTLPG